MLITLHDYTHGELIYIDPAAVVLICPHPSAGAEGGSHISLIGQASVTVSESPDQVRRLVSPPMPYVWGWSLLPIYLPGTLVRKIGNPAFSGPIRQAVLESGEHGLELVSYLVDTPLGATRFEPREIEPVEPVEAEK